MVIDQIGNATLYLGDSREVLNHIDQTSVDSCVVDPPYGLNFMGKAWDYDVPDADMWRLVADTLKPGAHLLSFFGSRTYHRGAVQIEDAGFEIRDQIMWLYGSGFPKSLDVSKAIDKAAGADRKVTHVVDRAGNYRRNRHTDRCHSAYPERGYEQDGGERRYDNERQREGHNGMPALSKISDDLAYLSPHSTHSAPSYRDKNRHSVS